MAKKMYIGGLDNKARKVRKMNFGGTDNLARKVKKGYIGVGDVARPFFGGGELVYYGPITTTESCGSQTAATTVGDHALFIGGGEYPYNTTTSYRVHAFSDELVYTTAPQLTTPRYLHAATSVGDYAVIGGGIIAGDINSTAIPTDTVEVYDVDLVHSTAPNLTVRKSSLFAASVEGYAIMAGGSAHLSSEEKKTLTADVYDENLVKSVAADMPSYRNSGVSLSFEHFVAFVRGYDSDEGEYSTAVTIYDEDLVQRIGPELAYGAYRSAGTVVGQYGILVGGSSGGGGSASLYNYAEAFDEDGVSYIIEPLDEAKNQLAATTLGDVAIFHGGYGKKIGSASSSFSDYAETYDSDLVKGTTFTCANRMYEHVGATIGDYGIFFGRSNDDDFAAEVFALL